MLFFNRRFSLLVAALLVVACYTLFVKNVFKTRSPLKILNQKSSIINRCPALMTQARTQSPPAPQCREEVNSLLKDQVELFETFRQTKSDLGWLSCTHFQTGYHGGWCLTKHFVDTQHVPADPGLVPHLRTLFHNSTVGDFGAGVGQFKEPLSQDSTIQWQGFDGAGNVEDFTSCSVRYLDLAEPVYLGKRFSWILSLEVGEHMPGDFADTFISNLHTHNCRGIVLSWAIPGQNGHQHVNCQTNDWVRSKLEPLGYVSDLPLETKMRASIKTCAWLANTLMVFRRKFPLC